MDAVNLASKIAKLVSFYGDTEVSVTPDESTVHKRLGEAYPVVFTATAGVNDKELEEYQRALDYQRLVGGRIGNVEAEIRCDGLEIARAAGLEIGEFGGDFGVKDGIYARNFGGGPGTGSVGMPVASPIWRPIMLCGSMTVHPATSAGATFAAIWCSG